MTNSRSPSAAMPPLNSPCMSIPINSREDQRGGIVERALTFDHSYQAFRDTELLENCDYYNGIVAGSTAPNSNDTITSKGVRT